jgi:flagellar assembly factor FliW
MSQQAPIDARRLNSQKSTAIEALTTKLALFRTSPLRVLIAEILNSWTKVLRVAADQRSERGDMPVLETTHFGKLSYETDSELEFPVGLPGFDDRKRFVAVRFVENDPLIYLQSIEDPALCFITMPILAADPQYRLKLTGEDLGYLGLNSARQPRIGDDVLCLTVLSIRESGPTANLLAPIVVNLRNRKAVQAVAPESHYPHQFALMPQETMPQEAAVC